eukprot:jgi/Ulvmu1/8871/UM049_0053.1
MSLRMPAPEHGCQSSDTEEGDLTAIVSTPDTAHSNITYNDQKSVRGEECDRVSGPAQLDEFLLVALQAAASPDVQSSVRDAVRHPDAQAALRRAGLHGLPPAKEHDSLPLPVDQPASLACASDHADITNGSFDAQDQPDVTVNGVKRDHLEDDQVQRPYLPPPLPSQRQQQQQQRHRPWHAQIRLHRSAVLEVAACVGGAVLGAGVAFAVARRMRR